MIVYIDEITEKFTSNMIILTLSNHEGHNIKYIL